MTDETVETIDTEAPAAEPAAVAVATVETPAPAVATATATAPTRSRRAGQPIQTVGRRKEAIVRVRLIPGTGKFLLNGRELENYFPSKVHQQSVKEPLVIVEKVDQFDVFANLRGGGTTGQAGGLRLAIARALIENDPDDRPALKKAGFLTRDARATERKKYGLKKARKAPQYSKR
ncbi:30S ribosomal protein S9 [Dactylosporangium sp. NPDC049525]|uniref:30S ribosomal protein S9 n=1 Tax=Dactylosporangium sp. NPDC049525 TaxID=3154730 RepID=UPI0034128897